MNYFGIVWVTGHKIIIILTVVDVGFWSPASDKIGFWSSILKLTDEQDIFKNKIKRKLHKSNLNQLVYTSLAAGT